MKRLLVAALVVAMAIRLSAEDGVTPSPAADQRGRQTPAVPSNGSEASAVPPAALPAKPSIAASLAVDEEKVAPATSKDVPKDVPTESPKAVPTEAPKDASAEAPKDAPAETPKVGREFHSVFDSGPGTEGLDYWWNRWMPSDSTSQWFEHPCVDSQGTTRLLEDGHWLADDLFCDVSGYPPNLHDGAVRFGWWSVDSSGSQTRTGEYQTLTSSPFIDLDTFFNDGTRSLDLSLSMLDNEASAARVRYYGPWMSANIRFDSFLRRWDHDPMAAPDVGPPVPSKPNNIVSDDLNVGQDYAIRVQKFDAKFKGQISDNLNWKVNVFSMRKFGERQANSTGHCFDLNPLPGNANSDNRCHVLSQRQRIDWTTTEVQPLLEARWDNVNIEYSHTFRSFGQTDQLVNRDYTRFGYSAGSPPVNGVPGAPFINNYVPENMTNIDRLKVNVNLNDDNQFYANMYLGQTHNEFRDTRRHLGGYDFRLTNQAIDRVTLTAYTSMYEETNQLPPTYFNKAPLGLGESKANVDHPVDYNRARVGVKSVWKPFDDGGFYDSRDWDPWHTLRLNSGYEYYKLSRDFATYTSSTLGTFTQPDTKTHQIDFGPSLKWTPEVDSYIRYKGLFTEDPLIGVRESQGRFNTNQPTQSHCVDVGGSWMPSTNFMATAQVSLVNSWNDSYYASKAVGNRPINYTEQDYPFITTLWYAPTDRLSLTGAYSYSSNVIDQDITVGFRGPSSPGSPFETTPWNYKGDNHLVSFNATYAWTPSVNLLGGVECDRGSNTFGAPPMTDNIILSASPVVLGGPGNWSQLPTYSAVKVQTVRLTAGVDWQPLQQVSLYSRYTYFDWDDLSQGTYTGTAHMLLAGASVLW